MNVGKLKAALVGLDEKTPIVFQLRYLKTYGSAEVEESEYYDLEYSEYDAHEDTLFIISPVEE